MAHESIYELISQTARQHAAKPAFRYKEGGQWVDESWGDAWRQITRIGKALIACGVEAGDRVAILSQTRREWVQSDLGIVCSGCVTVGIYPSNLAPDCAYVIDHSDSMLIIAEDEDQIDKILAEREQLTRLKQIVVIDGPGDAAHGILSWEEFLAKGDAVADEKLSARGEAVTPDDLASLVYTSGTTGVPKGVMITHHNLLFTMGSANHCLPMRGDDFVVLLFLPLAHVFARLIVYCCLGRAVTIAFAEDITALAANIREIRPHLIPSVPRVFEKVYDKITSGVEAAGGVKQKLFNWALGVGRQVSTLRLRKQPVTGLLALKHSLAERLVFKKIQAAMGGRLHYAVSGAAPLNRDIAEFFHACGITILEGIGMTENTSFSNVNRIDNNKFGTVGPVGPGIEQLIAEDGEVLFRGPNVMKGYFKNPESTAETIDEEGWLHTGDIGEIDDDGFLTITDRKKDLIVTAGGKNVAPQRIERVLRTSHYIAQACAYGDKRRYITALLTLDPDNIKAWAAENGLGSVELDKLADESKIQELLSAEVERLNHQLASYETVKRFHVLPRDFTIEDGELTPTMKIRRKLVYERYGGELDALY